MLTALLFCNMMFCLFVLTKMKLGKWRVVPTVLFLGNFVFWLVQIGAIAIL